MSRWYPFYTVLLILVTSLHATTGLFSLGSKDVPMQLVDCINEAIGEGSEEAHDSATTWEGAMGDSPAKLHALSSWWSSKPLLIPLTVVTQLSANRVTQLWAQCRSWPGPLSAAIHIALQQPKASPLSLRNEQVTRIGILPKRCDLGIRD